MAAASAARTGRQGVALAMVVVIAAAAAAWGAPAAAGAPTAAAAAAVAKAAVVAVEPATGLDGGAALGAPKGWVKTASRKWRTPASDALPAAKPSVNPATKMGKPAAKKKGAKPAAKGQPKRSAAKQGSRPPPPGGPGGRGHPVNPECSPLRLYLVDMYMLSWRLAMLDAAAGRAFGLFATARAHAAAYVAAHPRSPTTVCGLRPVNKALSHRATAIVAAHRNRGGALPPSGRFRGMSPAERAAMARVLSVPLNKAVPKDMLPKRVPMVA